MRLTLEPPDLCGGPIALLVAGGDAEDDGGLGGVVDVGVGQAGGLDQAGRAGAAVDPHEGQLGRARAGGRGGLAGLDGQVHRVLGDLPRRDGGGLPRQLSAVQVLHAVGEERQTRTLFISTRGQNSKLGPTLIHTEPNPHPNTTVNL